MGVKILDEVCLDVAGTICVEQEFSGVMQQKGLSNLHADGILGMGPRSAANRLFLKNLADSGKIEANVFAFSIGKDNEKSSVTIGGY